jgi:peptide deformylase
MEPLQLRFYPDPILRQMSEEVTVFDDDLRVLAEAMIDTMRREAGIGLAAPQIGLGKRLIIALEMKDVDDSNAESVALVNPRVLSRSSELWSYEEGCLSIPGVTASILRPLAIEVEYQDFDGETHRMAAQGMFARIIQHEIDHLDGRLFIDYLSSAQKSLVKSKLKKLADGQTSS